MALVGTELLQDFIRMFPGVGATRGVTVDPHLLVHKK
jgi:hypothetical protein